MVECDLLRETFVAKNRHSRLTTDEYIEKRRPFAQAEIDRRFSKVGDKPAGQSLAADLDPKMEYINVWERDNGITSRRIKQRILKKAYLKRAAQRRAAAGRTSNDLGHALFNQKGEPVPWLGQNDGPGYRFLNEKTEVDELLKAGKRDEAIKIYNATDKTVNSAKWDAEYLAHHAFDDTVELWEEEGGRHLHTMLLDHAALENAYELELKFSGGKVTEDAVNYRKTADKIKLYLRKNAWHEDGGYLKSTVRQNLELGFVHKSEPLDTASILGILHANSTIDPSRAIFRVTSDEVMATMAMLEEKFGHNYRINSLARVQNPANRGATYLGRYTHDAFHGGNPWVLTTYAGGQYYFELGTAILNGRQIKISPVNQKFFARLLNRKIDDPVIAVGKVVQNELKKEVVLAAKQKGEAYIGLIRDITPDDGILHEQIARGFHPDDIIWPWAKPYLDVNKISGEEIHMGGNPVGARNLLWNNEAELSTFDARDQLIRDLKRRRWRN
jgi:hypothetical protein